MKAKTFPLGGIHPSDDKETRDRPIITLPPPDKAVVFLNQHLGAPSRLLVKRGDRVRVGTPIGESTGFISANIHSPVSGKVKKIEARVDASGYRHPAVVIEVEGDEWEESIDRSERLHEKLEGSSDDIIRKIESMGIVGLGGAAFPSHIKYMLPEDKRADTLIINGIECEPRLTADHRLMLEKTDQIMQGIEAMKKAGRVSYALIGIENNKPDAIEKLTEKAKYFTGTEVAALKVKYPQGAEKQLIKALLDRRIPGGGLPMDVGVIINNVGTAYAIYEGVFHRRPLVDRVITVSGLGLKNPGNYRVRVGTTIRELLGILGEELPEMTCKVILGGPMTGKAVVDLELPVSKGTSGVLMIDREECRSVPTHNCIRCGRCISVCPMGLRPYLLEKLARMKNFVRCERNKIMDCLECGSCSYVCPSAIALLDYIKYGKNTVLKIMKERRKK